MLRRAVRYVIEHVLQRPIVPVAPTGPVGPGPREGTEAWQNLVMFHEWGALLVARIDHVCPSGPPDRIAIRVHLQQVLSLASGEPLDNFRLGRAPPSPSSGGANCSAANSTRYLASKCSQTARSSAAISRPSPSGRNRREQSGRIARVHDESGLAETKNSQLKSRSAIRLRPRARTIHVSRLRLPRGKPMLIRRSSAPSRGLRGQRRRHDRRSLQAAGRPSTRTGLRRCAG